VRLWCHGGLIITGQLLVEVGNKDKGTWLPSVCGSRSCCQGVVQCDIWWLVAVRSLLSWVQLHPVTAICVCGSRFMLSCWPKWYLLTVDQAVMGTCMVTQCVCYGNGHAIMGALSGVLLSTSIWLFSVRDNRSCCHGGPSGVFGCPQVPDYLVCMTTGHAVMGTRPWVGGSRSYCHRFMVSSWLL